MAVIKQAFIKRDNDTDAVYFCGDMWMVENGGNIKVHWADDEEKIRDYFQNGVDARDSDAFLDSIRGEAEEIRLEDIAGSEVYDLLAGYFQREEGKPAIKRAVLKRDGGTEALYFCGDMWMVENGGSVKVKWADSEEQIQEYFQEHLQVDDSEQFLRSQREEASEIRIEELAGSELYDILAGWNKMD